MSPKSERRPARQSLRRGASVLRRMLTSAARLTARMSHTAAAPAALPRRSYVTKKASTASYILIGDEILSGTVRDTNGFYLTNYFRKKGIDLVRIEVIPDKV